MASVSNINGKWRALIRRKGHKSISKWFDTKAKAVAWAKGIEDQMDGKGKLCAQLDGRSKRLLARHLVNPDFHR